MGIQRTTEEIREAVRERYAEAARSVQNSPSGCCGASRIDAERLYRSEDLTEVPGQAAAASLGCGNPTLLAALHPGEIVLDLGSGGGIDVLLSAKRVGPTGKAYGLDMTDEMLALARANAHRAGVTNVDFLKGNIETIPLPNSTVDVIISNCVINLSTDKDSVLAEAYRVLKPGGRLAVADIVVQGEALPEKARDMLALWAGCIAGALTEQDYQHKLNNAGFTNIELQELKAYGLNDVPAEMQCCVPADLGLNPETRVISAFISAIKPSEI